MLTGPGQVRDRDREIVRQTAELLASGVSLSELFEGFCLLLARFVDASVVFVAIGSKDKASIEYAYDHGTGRHDPHPVNPASQTQRVLTTGQPFLMRTKADFEGLIVPLRMQNQVEDDSVSAVFVPLRFGSEVIGVLSVQSPQPHAYDEEDLHLLQTCALYVAVAVHADEIRSKKEAFESAASIDALTRVANRWAFDQRLAAEWRHARRDGAPISLILLDIDWFKPFNDTYGHVAGDACLEQVASAMQACMNRETDLVARYGGEEFAAILCATDAAGALALAERIRAAIENLQIPHLGSPLGRVTVSCGAATAQAVTEKADLLVRTADRALYAAKTAGRNQVLGEVIGARGNAEPKRLAGNNLRAASTTFLGRLGELRDITALLEAEQVVTVTGPGGVGKTRLALAVAQHRLYAYLDGAWLVDFSAIRDAQFIDSVIASAVGIVEQVGRPFHETLVSDLQSKNRLLILDNCEHLIAPIADLVAEIAVPASPCKILVTSREPLRIGAETRYDLRPMEESEAVALFVERACEAFAGYAPSQEDTAEIATLCKHLDRLPLAIELAAPRVKTMPPREIAQRLNERFRVLIGNRRQADPRQQTVYAMIKWSYELLEARAQRLFESLSIFPSSFDADSVRDICADGVLEPWDIASVLDDLLEKNLVVIESTEGRERFRMLESTREFAKLALDERGDREDLVRRHIGYFRAFAQRADEQIDRGQLEQIVQNIGTDWENIRIAMHRSLVDREIPPAGRMIVLSMRRYWAECGQFAEGRYWIDQALATLAKEDGLSERGELLYAAALMAHSRGDFYELDAVATELVEVHKKTGDAHGMTRALNALGNAKFHSGKREEAELLYRRALEGYRLADDRRGIAVALLNLGSLEADLRRDFPAARRRFEESLALFREMGISINMAMVLANLGEICAHENDFDNALVYANESIKVSERLGNESMGAWQLTNIAVYRIQRGEYDLALSALRTAYDKLSLQHHIEFIANYSDAVTMLLWKLGRLEDAAQVLGFVTRYRKLEHVPRLATSLTTFGRCADSIAQALKPALYASLLEQGGTLAFEDVDRLLRAPGEPVSAP